MRLTNLNTVDTIGANCLFAEIGPFNILVDAGINPKEEGRKCIPDFSLIDSVSLDFIIITHCHLDHLGSLPIAVRHHPEAEIITSVPTAIIAARMMVNSVNVMKRIREEKGINEYPLYTINEVVQIEQRVFPLPFRKPRVFEKNGEKLEITLYPSGHIPGAAGIMFKYKHRKVFFTGDVLFQDMRILKGADFPKEPLDTLVMETTRGATQRMPGRDRKSEIDRLFRTMNRTLQHGGSVLLPVFALGRMQEILAIIHDAIKAGKLKPAPIFTSGLGMSLIDSFDIISRKTGLVNFRKSILHDLKAKPMKKKLEPGVDPANGGIYVLSSGMLVEHTPSYSAAASMIHNPHNTFCFIGYCDPDTPGGKLLAHSHDEPFVFEKLNHVAPVRAQIERFDMSGHADRDELLEFAISTKARAIVLTHGDPEARDWFAEQLYENPVTSKSKIIDPKPREKVNV